MPIMNFTAVQEEIPGESTGDLDSQYRATYRYGEQRPTDKPPRITIDSLKPRDTTPSVPVVNPVPITNPAPVVNPVIEPEPAPIAQPVMAPTPAPPPSIINNFYTSSGVDPDYEKRMAAIEQERLALERQRLDYSQELARLAMQPAPSNSVPGGGTKTLQPPDDPYTANDARLADLLGSMFAALGNAGGSAAPVEQKQPAVLISQPTGPVESGGSNMGLIVVVLILGIGGYLWYRNR